MATPGQLIKLVSEVTGVSPSKTENIYDELRKSGDVPVGVRGRYGISATSDAAAKLLIAVCCAEHIKDAPDAIQRYSNLDPVNSIQENIVVPGPRWSVVSEKFPRLARLKRRHHLLDALIALIESFKDDPDRPERATVTFGSPYPWAAARVILYENEAPSTMVAVTYRHEGEHGSEDDPEFIALIDPSKERQRRRFAKLSGDLRITSEISEATLSEIGSLLKEP